MKILRFIGDPLNGGHGPEVINFYGLEMPKGKDVKCDDPAIIAKAEGSSHFIVEAVKLGRPPRVKADENSQ